MLHTLFSRLLIALCLLFIASACWLLAVSQQASQAFQHEVTQRLHLTLADHILADTPIWNQQALDRAAIKHAFHTMMILGPAIELYVLDPEGKLLAYDAPEEKIKQHRVDIEAIKNLLNGASALPVYGDDPRSTQTQKVFSVAPVYLDKELKGYLYIILGGENYDSLVNRLQGNHIYHLAVQSALIGLLLLLTIGIVIFYAITRPLSRLSKQVSGYGQALTGSLNEDTHRQSVAEIEALLSNMDNQSRDEVAILQNNFSSMARKIAEQMQHLQLTDQQRKELLSHLSHDLKTPIAAQRAYLETLLDDAESTKDTAQLSPQQHQQFLSSALRQCDLLASRVQEILELSRLEAGQLRLNKETIDIAELSSDLTQQLGPLARQQGVNIHFSPPPQEACVEADPALLNRLFLNLIENAIHHSVKGGNITLGIEKQGQGLQFSVVDEGRGIAIDDLPYIFQAFYRGKQNLTANQHKQAKQGLGLAICQRIAQLHDTEVKVESVIDQGSRFSVVFKTND